MPVTSGPARSIRSTPTARRSRLYVTLLTGSSQPGPANVAAAVSHTSCAGRYGGWVSTEPDTPASTWSSQYAPGDCR